MSRFASLNRSEGELETRVPNFASFATKFSLHKSPNVASWRPASVLPASAPNIFASVTNATLGHEAEQKKPPGGPRHVVLLSKYPTMAGPAFSNAVTELVARSCLAAGEPVPSESNGGVRVALVPTARYGHCRAIGNRLAARADAAALATQLTAELKLGCCEVLELDALNPVELCEKLARLAPHLLWVCGGNTFFLRYHMHASGFDNLARELCSPPPPGNSGDPTGRGMANRRRRAVVYVGQSAGGICAGASIATAYFKGVDDPSEAPAPPPLEGLGLAGPARCLFPHYNAAAGHAALVSRMAPQYALDTRDVLCLRDDQAWVFSQAGEGGPAGDPATTQLVLNQDGSLEDARSTAEKEVVVLPVSPEVEAEFKPGAAAACDKEPARWPRRPMPVDVTCLDALLAGGVGGDSTNIDPRSPEARPAKSPSGRVLEGGAPHPSIFDVFGL
jgi:peptidase E